MMYIILIVFAMATYNWSPLYNHSSNWIILKGKHKLLEMSRCQQIYQYKSHFLADLWMTVKFKFFFSFSYIISLKNMQELQYILKLMMHNLLHEKLWCIFFWIQLNQHIKGTPVNSKICPWWAVGHYIQVKSTCTFHSRETWGCPL
jgi:hypothetical protein